MKFFNIYGFKIEIDGPAEHEFYSEMKTFEAKKLGNADLKIIASEKDMPIKLRGSNMGIKLPFGGKDNIVEYNPGISGSYILYMIEPLFDWKDRCFIHAGAVAKNGKAILFPASGGVGKTRSVLELLKKGYWYLSDDWLIIGNKKAYIYPKSLHIFDYNLKDKEIRKKVLGWKSGFYMAYFGFLDSIKDLFNNRYINIIVDRIKPCFNVDIRKLYPNTKVISSADIDQVYYLTKHKEKINSEKLAEKMALMNKIERAYFYEEYNKFAFFNGKSRKIERKFSLDRKIILNSVRDRKIESVQSNNLSKLYSTL